MEGSTCQPCARAAGGVWAAPTFIGKEGPGLEEERTLCRRHHDVANHSFLSADGTVQHITQRLKGKGNTAA
ncbi:hypothetical protein NDU88_004302 [Pleurodeles waltl]|uniref:HNH endonuclease n=1 Tax=Pleurodeles waltl TaxID=8319 RepID=A0AAV7V0S8_PLEWA|nr:hypothetical protein NDU88_004302 [Pleurodeles waltl]